MSSHKKLVTLIDGPPGAGKGTIGKYLHQTGGFYHLSMGDLVRSKGLETPIGTLLPDDIAFTLLKDNLSDIILSDETNILLDGFPRTMGEKNLLSHDFTVNKVFILTCEPDISVERCLRRGENSGRISDIDKQTIQKRIQIYNEQTLEVLQTYPNDIVTLIDTGFETNVEKFKDKISNIIDQILVM